MGTWDQSAATATPAPTAPPATIGGNIEPLSGDGNAGTDGNSGTGAGDGNAGTAGNGRWECETNQRLVLRQRSTAKLEPISVAFDGTDGNGADDGYCEEGGIFSRKELGTGR